MSKIGAVLFDYGQVLSGLPDQAAWAEIRRLLNVDDEPMQTTYWRYRDAYDRGALSGVAYWHQVANDMGRTLDGPRLAALIAEDNVHWTQPNAPMIEWAARLQRAGIKTGILSNIGDEMETGVRAKFAWLDGFAHHTFSHRLGIAKPDEAIYRHAVQEMGLPAEEILFVDDKLENIEAAQSVGMVAIQYSGHEAFVKAMQDAGLSRLLYKEE